MKTPVIITTAITLLTLTFAPPGFSGTPPGGVNKMDPGNIPVGATKDQPKAPQKVGEATITRTGKTKEAAKKNAMNEAISQAATKQGGPTVKVVGETYTGGSPVTCILDATLYLRAKVVGEWSGHWGPTTGDVAKISTTEKVKKMYPDGKIITMTQEKNEKGYIRYTATVEFPEKGGRKFSGEGSTKGEAEKKAYENAEKDGPKAASGYHHMKITDKNYEEPPVKCELKVEFWTK